LAKFGYIIITSNVNGINGINIDDLEPGK